MGEHILELPPYAMMQAIDAHNTQDSSMEAHHKLCVKATNVRICPRETLYAFFDSHLSIRSEMFRAQYPMINDERTTIQYIIQGLGAKPYLRSHITLLTGQRPNTVKEFKLLLEIILLDNIGPDPYTTTFTRD